LSLACWDYDRTQAIADGRVGVEGVDLTYLPLRVEETFFRMVTYREFDVAEMSLSTYVMSKFRDDPFIAIPIFPSRVFRHSSIFINEQSGIRTPQDLAGKRVGVPEYQITAAVWIRGMLADEYGVPVSSVEYLTGGGENAGRTEKPGLALPPGIRVRPIPSDKTLAQMLAAGEIDALYTAAAPSTFLNGAPGVRRLWTDYVPVERAYFERTRIFPIMHTVVLRRELYERHRWLAMEFYKAFARAQALAYEDLYRTTALKTMRPWGVAEADSVRELMGDDFWPYGVEANRHTLETFLTYHYDQGLSKRLLSPEELFAPETLQAYKI
jgi:4,5-dihydroxyphthalate decarboxylase